MMQGPVTDNCRSLRPASLPLLRCRTSLFSARSRIACQPRCFHSISNQGSQHRSVRAAAASAKKDQPRAASAFKEQSRETARVVFDFARWKKHRSTNRYLRHITGLPVSALVRGLAGPLLYILVLATGVCVYQYCYQAGLLPIDFLDLELKSKEPFALTSFALSLLLVFRTNASYERWDGARKMWGLVLNRSRDIVRQGLAWIPHDQVELRSLLCRWTPAFSKSLMCHLRKDEDLEKELRGILLPYEIAAVMQAQHRPNYVMQVLASIVKEANLPTAAGLAMEQNITVFEDCLGGCERILRTPIPLFYTRHTSRFLMIMLTMLPFSLWGTCAWSTIPLTVVIAFLLLGVEEIGVAIEEPFSILALEAISNTALANVRELQATHSTSALSGDFVGDSDLVSAPQMLAIATASAVGNSIEEEYGGLGGMPWVQPGTALTAEEEEEEQVLRARQRSKRRW